MGSCSPAEWGLPCSGVSRAPQRDRSRVEKRSQGRGRKAAGLQRGPLALEGGKGRQALPLVTNPRVAQRAALSAKGASQARSLLALVTGKGSERALPSGSRRVRKDAFKPDSC